MKQGSYERVAKRYESMDGLSNLISLGRLHLLRKMLLDQLDPEDVLLDVGCGSGIFATQCAKKHLRVTAMDVSSTMIEIAKEEAMINGVSDRIDFICSDVLKANMDRKFDVITLVYVIDIIPTYPEAVAVVDFANKWLKPGGRIIIADETLQEEILLQHIIKLIRGPFFRILSKKTNNKFHEIFDPVQILRDAGLIDIIQIKAPGGYLGLSIGYKKR